MRWYCSFAAVSLLLAACGESHEGDEASVGEADASPFNKGDSATPGTPAIDGSVAVDAAGPPGDDGAMLLPWAAGTSHRVSQGHFGVTHVGVQVWAWDFSMVVGTPILAAHSGEVRATKGDSAIGGCSSAYGNAANYVVIDGRQGTESLYLHLQEVEVEVGDQVERGQRIGLSGNTGWSCAPHLHFQVQSAPLPDGWQSWFRQSIPAEFHDTGEGLDPEFDSWPVSANQQLP